MPVWFCRPCSGSRGRARSGAICRPVSGTGTRSIAASGVSRVFSKACSVAVSDRPDRERGMSDGPLVTGPRAGQGAKGALRQARGRSKGGWTTKILALGTRSALWSASFFCRATAPTSVGAPLIHGLSCDALLTGREFDNTWILEDGDRRRHDPLPRAETPTQGAARHRPRELKRFAIHLSRSLTRNAGQRPYDARLSPSADVSG